jgi:hypothetical protein
MHEEQLSKEKLSREEQEKELKQRKKAPGVPSAVKRAHPVTKDTDNFLVTVF